MSILDRFSLKNRIALVTAGSGPLFGSSVTEALAEAGATVITASRSLERNQKFAAQLQELGHDVHAMQVDITDVDSIGRLQQSVISQFGRLDVLVNSALTRSGHTGLLDDLTVENISDVASGDFVGLFEITRKFLQGMVEQGSGSIINIASIYGVVGNDPNLYVDTDMKPAPTYPFVKAGMINFSRTLACQYGKHGVRVNCISPGGYLDNQPEIFLKRYTERVPVRRMLENDDLKGAIVFLASDASTYITGENLMVDGGWTCL